MTFSLPSACLPKAIRTHIRECHNDFLASQPKRSRSLCRLPHMLHPCRLHSQHCHNPRELSVEAIKVAARPAPARCTRAGCTVTVATTLTTLSAKAIKVAARPALIAARMPAVAVPASSPAAAAPAAVVVRKAALRKRRRVVHLDNAQGITYWSLPPAECMLPYHVGLVRMTSPDCMCASGLMRTWTPQAPADLL